MQGTAWCTGSGLVFGGEVVGAAELLIPWSQCRQSEWSWERHQPTDGHGKTDQRAGYIKAGTVRPGYGLHAPAVTKAM